jgi:hypothetical protein
LTIFAANHVAACEVSLMGIQDIIRWLLPREEHFYEFLERQAKAAHEGAKALSTFATNGTSATLARDAVQKIEHEGDSSFTRWRRHSRRLS